jgi:deoxyadenosine/deoxycytidine kinase
MDRPRYIAVEGPIGVGKTSLVERLCQEFNGRGIYEKAYSNPFLKDFYLDRKKHAFQTQLFFLLSRYQQQKELNQQELFSSITVSDYIFTKDRIFAHLNLDDNEILLYEQVYKLLDAEILKPDLVVFLQTSTEILINRIGQRGKEFEKNIASDYIDEVSQAYNKFFFSYNETPLLVVDASELDFVNSNDDFRSLVKEIKRMKKGTQHYIPRFTAQL